MNLKKIILGFNFLSLACLFLFLTSCKDEFLDFGHTDFPQEGAIRIGASVNGEVLSRTYIRQGDVRTGTFTLTYPFNMVTLNAGLGAWEHKYTFAEVRFGFSGNEDIGFANMGEDKSLVWAPKNSAGTDGKNIGIWVRNNYEVGTQLFLDNFNARVGNKTTNGVDTTKVIKFNEYNIENPYKAAVFDYVDGTNDLLWGESYALLDAPWINFDLHHNMSRLKVIVTVDEQSEYSLGLNLEHAQVYITNLLPEAEKYDRLTGDLIFKKTDSEAEEMALRKSIVLVYNEIEGSEIPNPDVNLQDTEITNRNNFYSRIWESPYPVFDGTSEFVKTYTTKDFVLPPQYISTIANQVNRPRLIIRVPTKDYNSGFNPDDNNSEYPESVKYIEFSNYLPGSMFIEVNGQREPRTFNFMKEHAITLRTSMTPGEPELEFLPVTVEKWVDVGVVQPQGKQAGFYTAQDFYNLIDVYNQNNEFQMGRYGYKKADGSWNFRVGSAVVTFELEKILGKMIQERVISEDPEKKTAKYTIDFMNRYETLLMPDGVSKYDFVRSNESKQLEEILRAEVTDETRGLNTADNVTDLIESYNSKSIDSWRQALYGKYNTESKKWIFKVNQSMDLDYLNIHTQMIPGDRFGLPDYEIESWGEEITVKVLNDPSTSTEGTVDADRLYAILSAQDTQAGIYSADEFNAMMAAFKANNEEELAKYGSKNDEDTWIFKFYRNINLGEINIQGGMPGDNYAFDFQGNRFKATLTQFDNTKHVASSDDLIKVLNLSSFDGINSEEEFMAMIAAYNEEPESDDYEKNLSKYAAYCFSSSKPWIFSVREDLLLEKNDIQGSMVPEEGKPQYTFNFGTKVITLPLTYNKDGKIDKSELYFGLDLVDEFVKLLSTPNP